MPAWIELAQLANAAVYRDNLLSALDMGITNIRTSAFPTKGDLTVVAQFAFSEPDLDRSYTLSIVIADPAGTVLASNKMDLVPQRPPGADPTFPFTYVMIGRLLLDLVRSGYHEATVAIEGIASKTLKFHVGS